MIINNTIMFWEKKHSIICVGVGCGTIKKRNMFISFTHFFRFLYYKITKIYLAYLNFTFPYLAALSVRSLHQ